MDPWPVCEVIHTAAAEVEWRDWINSKPRGFAFLCSHSHNGILLARFSGSKRRLVGQRFAGVYQECRSDEFRHKNLSRKCHQTEGLNQMCLFKKLLSWLESGPRLILWPEGLAFGLYIRSISLWIWHSLIQIWAFFVAVKLVRFKKLDSKSLELCSRCLWFNHFSILTSESNFCMHKNLS